jgi:hypothetical protein
MKQHFPRKGAKKVTQVHKKFHQHSGQLQIWKSNLVLWFSNFQH